MRNKHARTGGSLWHDAKRQQFSVEDRHRIVGRFSLGSYLLLVDYTGRLFREGKATISGEVTETLDRIGPTAETWQARLEKLRSGRLLGRFFAASRQRLWVIAERLGLRRAVNLGGCVVT
jgi:hypothetical protein